MAKKAIIVGTALVLWAGDIKSSLTRKHGPASKEKKPQEKQTSPIDLSESPDQRSITRWNTHSNI
jgi:hypothetical protein